MTSVTVLRQLPQLFRYADVEKFTGNANVFLTRALAKGFVERVARGVYLNAMRDGKPAIEEVACFLRTPSYISCEWALNRHNVIIQAPFVCTVLTLDTAVGQSRNVEFGGVTIEFSHIASRLFNGFETRDGFNLRCRKKLFLIPFTNLAIADQEENPHRRGRLFRDRGKKRQRGLKAGPGSAPGKRLFLQQGVEGR